MICVILSKHGVRSERQVFTLGSNTMTKYILLAVLALTFAAPLAAHAEDAAATKDGASAAAPAATDAAAAPADAAKDKDSKDAKEAAPAAAQ